MFGVAPAIWSRGNDVKLGYVMLGVLLLGLLTYAGLYALALSGRFAAARNSLFGVWCFYGGVLPWFIRPGYNSSYTVAIMTCVIIGFFSLVIVGVSSLEKWERASRWLIAFNAIYLISSLSSALLFFELSVANRPLFILILLGGGFLCGVSLFCRSLIKDTEQLLLVSEISSKRDQMQREQMRVARDAAQQASVSKSQFLANMSHELRTPLTAIIGYVELIKEDAAEDGVRQFDSDLDRVRDSAKHLHGLINDILDLSKIEAGKMEVAVDRIELARLVEQVTATAAPLVAAKNNTLVVERDLLPEFCVADEMKLKQVLLNLVSNAAKFTRDGQVTIRGAKIARKRQPWVYFEIEDTGIGIPSDKLSKIFEVFEQADGTTTRQYGGTGLGCRSRRGCVR